MVYILMASSQNNILERGYSSADHSDVPFIDIDS